MLLIVTDAFDVSDITAILHHPQQIAKYYRKKKTLFNILYTSNSPNEQTNEK